MRTATPRPRASSRFTCSPDPRQVTLTGRRPSGAGRPVAAPGVAMMNITGPPPATVLSLAGRSAPHCSSSAFSSISCCSSAPSTCCRSACFAGSSATGRFGAGLFPIELSCIHRYISIDHYRTKARPLSKGKWTTRAFRAHTPEVSDARVADCDLIRSS
jgi:hypothetical protein